MKKKDQRRLRTSGEAQQQPKYDGVARWRVPHAPARSAWYQWQGQHGHMHTPCYWRCRSKSLVTSPSSLHRSLEVGRTGTATTGCEGGFGKLRNARYLGSYRLPHMLCRHVAGTYSGEILGQQQSVAFGMLWRGCGMGSSNGLTLECQPQCEGCAIRSCVALQVMRCNTCRVLAAASGNSCSIAHLL